MPANPDLQSDRRAAISDILRNNPVTTQRRLVTALREAGFDATQSSVSRDFRVLGVSKTPEGYRLPEDEATPEQDKMREAAPFVRSIRAAGANLIVVKTAIGAAQRVALALDRGAWPEIIGTVSGDDTIFIACGSAVHSRNIIRRLDFYFSGKSQ